MTEVIATVGQAARWAGAGPDAATTWNPVYRALLDEPGPTPQGAPEVIGSEEAGADVVLRQLAAPALLVVAATDSRGTRRLRIALDPAGATVEQSEGDRPAHWAEIDVPEMPARITALLEEAGIAPAPARLDIGSRGDALRLTSAQRRIAHAALARGLTAAEAFASVPDLDDSLRDALTATGPRVSLSLTLHDPRGQVVQEPVSWSRLWATGTLGLYRLEQPTTPMLEIHPVPDGDVLGTVLPILEQGLRFAAACAVPGGAR